MTKKIETLPTIVTQDPDELQAIVKPTLGNVKICSYNKEFHAKLRARASSRVAIFNMQCSDSRGVLEPPHEYFGLNLPITGCFSVIENNRKTGFGQDIHLARPDRDFSPEMTSGSIVLGANMFTEALRADLYKLTGSNLLEIPEVGNRIETSGAVGLMLARVMFRLWSESNRAGAGPGSNIGIAELEDELITKFVMAVEMLADRRRGTQSTGIERAMARAEDYLDSHLTTAVSRADVAAAAGVSVRTLSRGFLTRHGTGPMGFLKTRRMDAAYRKLAMAEAGSMRVTDIAIRYGFTHFGQFAMEYKKAFGESPSVTLNR